MKIIDFYNTKKILENQKQNYMNWVKDCFIHKEDFVMPNKSRINQANGDYYAIMPCMYEKENVAMVKMIGRHDLKQNEVRSTMMSDIMLYRADNGILECLIDGEFITTVRTGAVAAFSTLLYSKKNFQIIGLIGLGNIMMAYLDALLPNIDRNIEIKLFKYHNNEERVLKRFEKYNNIKFILCDTYDDVVRNSDVIVSAVTKIDHDFCDISLYKEGVTVIPIMTLGFQNCDISFDKIFTDEIEQIRGFKYFSMFKSIENTTNVLNLLVKGRENDNERILVYNYGLAIFDLYFANKVLTSDSQDGVNIDYNYCKEKFFMN